MGGSSTSGASSASLSNLVVNGPGSNKNPGPKHATLSKEDIKRRVELLKLCCHFSYRESGGGQEERAESAEEEVERMERKKKEQTAKYTLEMKKILIRIEAHNRAIRYLIEEKHIPLHLLKEGFDVSRCGAVCRERVVETVKSGLGI